MRCFGILPIISFSIYLISFGNVLVDSRAGPLFSHATVSHRQEYPRSTMKENACEMIILVVEQGEYLLVQKASSFLHAIVYAIYIVEKSFMLGR
jgi:hypothetical protein